MVKTTRGVSDHQPTSLDRTSTLDAPVDPDPSPKERFAGRPLWDRNSD